MIRPRLLDLYCGAGGAGMGYMRAGFDLVGIDVAYQPQYPGTYIPADALKYLERYGKDYDAIHASPPCQASCTPLWARRPTGGEFTREQLERAGYTMRGPKRKRTR